jgi:protein-disulfide isomerase
MAESRPPFRMTAGTWVLLAIIVALLATVLWLVRPAAGPAAVTPSAEGQGTPGTVEAIPAFMVKGDPDAPVTFYEWSDYQCPYCSRYATATGPEIDRNYVDNGKMKVVFRDFPLTSMHPNAQKASEAARCVGVQKGSEGYWGMHDALFAKQDEWADSADAAPAFKTMAGELKVDQAKFDACLDNGEQKAAVEADMQAGMAQGIQVTPSFIANGNKIEGALPFESDANVEGFKPKLDIIVAGGNLPTPTVEPTVEQVEVDAPRVEVAIGDAPASGDADAPVTLIEYSDYECPYCGMFFTQSGKTLQDEYVAKGRVRHVFMDFPLSSIHPQAEIAARAAHCAGDQGADAYWTMHDALFARQSEWTGKEDVSTVFATLAGEAGLDGAALKACVDSGKHADTVQAGFDQALALGMNGTPTFIVNGQILVGVLDATTLADVVGRAERGESLKTWVPKPAAEATETAAAATVTK